MQSLKLSFVGATHSKDRERELKAWVFQLRYMSTPAAYKAHSKSCHGRSINLDDKLSTLMLSPSAVSY